MTDLVVAVVLLAAAGGARWLLGDLRTVPTGGGHRDEAPSVSVVRKPSPPVETGWSSRSTSSSASARL